MTTAVQNVETSAASVQPGPTRTGERLLVLDILRGFALFGILLANIHLMSGAAYAGRTPTTGDTIARLAGAIFVDGSFFPLFSFMFGLGFAIQMRRSEERGDAFGRRYARRLMFLMAIALLHWFLVWDAMILITYAALGAPLLLFRHSSSRMLLLGAGVCLVLQTFAYPLTRRADDALRTSSNTSVLLSSNQEERLHGTETLAARRVARLAHGSYVDALRERSERFERTFSRPSRYYPWIYGSIFAMFLLGLYAGKRRIPDSLEEHRTFLARVLWGGLAVGLAAKLAALIVTERIIPSWGSPTHLAAVGLERIGGPALGFCYAALIALVLRSSRGLSVLAPLAPVGRMALSNYLLQSVLATAVFYSHGLGLYGRVGTLAGFLVAAGIFLVQLPLSAWWLTHFRFGPVEWAWKSATYWRLQPLRLHHGVSTVVPTGTTR